MTRTDGDYKNIVILPADKGNATVLLNKEEYITKMQNLLTRVRSRRWLAAAADFFENVLAAAAAELFIFLAAAEENDG